MRTFLALILVVLYGFNTDLFFFLFAVDFFYQRYYHERNLGLLAIFFISKLFPELEHAISLTNRCL